MDFDLVLKNGLIVTASEVLPAGLEIGVKGGKISCIGTSLPTSDTTKVIDCEGGYITPGGIDSHVHLAQIPTADGWETGSRSAIAGGTTTILAFAPQSRDDDSLWPVLEGYHAKARDQSYADYGFHFILTNPTPTILNSELPLLSTREGITSMKLYMTYDSMKLSDASVLSVLLACRSLGMTTMIHAENHDMISLLISGLEARGHTAPYYHAIARPRVAEDEAAYRAISLAELVDAPILIVHMSSGVAMGHVRDAQTRLLPIHAETCPQYLFLMSEELQAKPHDHFSGAKHVCSPPLRHRVEDLEALWKGVANGTFTTWSSDHAPSRYDHPDGKKVGLVDGIPRFSKIPNGLPGIETRMALLFSQTEACRPVSEARLSLPRFVQLTAGNAARLYGLEGRKGSIAPGYDADFVIWYPGARGKTEIKQENLHHSIDYTPFEGIQVGNWPRWTIVRGQVVWDRDNGGVVGKMEYGDFLKRGRGKVVVGKTGGLPRGMLPEERGLWMDYKPYE
ncbi:dihydropyrimidinase-like protein [Elsinoe australis]|uniref:dihydropyrimidinase n=1 Tax=Elsinoe australis TaxID=40998 RepID=A0A4U7AVS1_9PEZI|nr:dihydropyrimidinase-like protein [Elsinoe australis]